MKLGEDEAKKRHGSKLAIAALAALEKGVAADGTVTVRVIHDGTNGVDVNRFIKVQDAALMPLADDVKAVLWESSEEKHQDT